MTTSFHLWQLVVNIFDSYRNLVQSVYRLLNSLAGGQFVGMGSKDRSTPIPTVNLWRTWVAAMGRYATDNCQS
jgi:hypothetical protein